MSAVVKAFYLIRYQNSQKNSDGKCTAETIAGLVTAGKLTQVEVDEILASSG